jgi:diguanylate cyclase (GGDEF)-like protein
MDNFPSVIITNNTYTDRKTLEIFLQQEGYQLSFAEKEDDAIHLAKELSPELFFLVDRYRQLRKKNHQLQLMNREIAELKNKLAESQELAMIDELTSLHNYRSLLHEGTREFNRAKRYSTSLSVLMIDVDEFKAVNDTFGHSVGSSILKELAAELTSKLRTEDIVGRLGGDEFLIFLPHTTQSSAHVLAERLRENMDSKIFGINGHAIHITISIGVAPLSPQMGDLTALMDAADIALYKAKSRRNAVA